MTNFPELFTDQDDARTDFAALVVRHLAGELNDAERNQLNAQLAASPEKRDDFVAICIQARLLATRTDLAILLEGTDLDPLAIDQFVPPPAVSDTLPTPGYFGSVIHGLGGFFSQELPRAYLIATVIVAIVLAVCSQIYVTYNQQVADNLQLVGKSDISKSHAASLHSERQTQPNFVGRITGMVDCEFSHENTVAVAGASVPLGRKYALARGLMEITYHSGAKVILQGPCQYEVNDPAGGYLSLGKLTARINKKEVASGQWSGVSGQGLGDSGKWSVAGRSVESQDSKIHGAGSKSEKSEPQPEATKSLFTVRTPSTIITDLGTEFGVAVQSNGQSTIQVYQGVVKAVAIFNGKPTGKADLVKAGQSLTVYANGMASDLVATSSQQSNNFIPFVRTLVPVKFIGPLPYQSFDDPAAGPNISPFSKAANGPFGSLSGSRGHRHWPGPDGQYFYLEDLESGDISAPGLARSGGRIGGNSKMCDSVDEDDGKIDNSNNGEITHSLWFGGNGDSLTLSFDEKKLGHLPTYVGFVITDCTPAVNTKIEVFGKDNRLLASQKIYNVTFATDNRASGAGKAEMARFCGFISTYPENGIARIVLTPIHVNGQRAEYGVEIDHIQYGYLSTVPEVSTPEKGKDP